MPLYEACGVTVGIIQHDQDPDERAAAYGADVTYGTNSEFGFDYLRDNMAQSIEDKVQHGGRIGEDGRPIAMHFFAIVDEVDNILIDEARTPLIISGAPEAAAEAYVQFAKLAKVMIAGKTPEGMDPRARKDFVADFDFEYDEKHKTVAVTEQGVAKAEKFLGIDHLYRAENGPLVNHLLQSLKAESLYKKRRRLRGRRRRGQDHRRVHRAHPGRPSLVGGPAPGRRGQGGRGGPGGEPDPRDHHVPELLPHVLQARRHDGHRPHRGDRVHEDLQAARSSRSRRTARWSARTRTTRSTRPRRASGPPSCDTIKERHERRPAGPRRHDLRRGLRDDLAPPRQARDPARGPQRQAGARGARGRHRRRGRPPRRGDHRHQHGGPRRRHQARRQRRAPDRARAAQPRPVRPATPTTTRPTRRSSRRSRSASPPTTRRSWRPAACSSAAPSATSRAASTTSCAAAPAARATRASRASSSPPRTTSSACSPATGSTRSSTGSGRSTTRATRSRSRPACSPSRSRRPRRRSRSRTSCIRKRVLEYDDVMNEQRRVVYKYRDEVLEGRDMGPVARENVADVIRRVVDEYTVSEYVEDWDVDGLFTALADIFPVGFGPDRLDEVNEREELVELLADRRDEAVRRARGGARRGAHARAGALPAAADHRQQVARAPVRHGLPARGHPPPRVRADRSARRLQERGVRPLHRPDELDLGGLLAHDLPRRGRGRGRRGARAPAAPGRPDRACSTPAASAPSSRPR